MYYVDLITFLEKLEKDWEDILQKANEGPPNIESQLKLLLSDKKNTIGRKLGLFPFGGISPLRLLCFYHKTN
jgi:hypothetical protein